MAVEVRAHRLGATLAVAARPGAGRTEALGEHGGALRVAVAAPPERGKANKELLRWLAGEFGLARGELEVIAGALGRKKVVLARGLAPGELERRIERLIDE